MKFMAKDRRVKNRNEQLSFHASVDEPRFRNRLANPFIVQKEIAIANRIAEFLPEGGYFLEVGCGEGANLAYLRQLWENGLVLGCDFSPAKAAFAGRMVDRALTTCADATALPFADASMDVVLLRDLLHHVDWNRDGVVSEAVRVVRPGGTVVIIEGDGRALLNRLFMALLPVERGLKNSTPAKLMQLAVRHGEARLHPLEPSLLVRAVGYVLGPRQGIAALPYRAAGLVEAALRVVLPASRWTYMMVTIRRASGRAA